MNTIELFTDGACIGNPGPGGYGAIVVTSSGTQELSGGFRKTTNNRMEMMGPLVALRALASPTRGVLWTDSQYVVNAIEKRWAIGWRKKNWMRTPSERASNSDLWAEMLVLLEPHEIRFRWVKGHAGHPENERCDELANAAARGRELAIDAGYEKPSHVQRATLFDG